MAPFSLATLHVGPGPELGALEYAVRVLLSLLAVGGVAVLVLAGAGAASVARRLLS